LLDGLPVCTDLNTKIWMSEARVPVIEQPFYAKANLATAGIGRAMRAVEPYLPGTALLSLTYVFLNGESGHADK
jgi:hypothetical protein